MQGWRVFPNQRGLHLDSRPLHPWRTVLKRRHTLHPTPSPVPANRRHIATSPTHSAAIATPNRSNVTNPASWLEPIEFLLPLELRRQPPNHNVPQASRSQSPRPTPPLPISKHLISSITYTLQQARKQSNLDLLVHIGLHEGRWNAMLWISQLLIENLKKPQAHEHLLDGVSTIDWPSDHTLHQITVRPFTCDNQPLHPLAHGTSLAKITSSDPSMHSGFAESQSGQILGELWQSLARLVIEAGTRDVNESKAIMAKVLGILVQLRRYNFIPEAIAHSNPNNDACALQQPPLFYAVSSQMLTALRDVEDYIQFGGVFQELSTRHYPGFHFGPQLWLEFILWCCVHGQWPMEGASIVAEMRKMTGSRRWSLISWRNNGQKLEKNRGTFSTIWSRLKRAWQFPKSEPLHPVAERTISAEVVVALIDGLMAIRTGSKGSAKHAMIILDKISALKKVLDRDKMSLGISTWDAIISRFAESPGLVSLERNPRMMETVLALAETYGREISSTNGLQNSEANGSSLRLNYVFDGSAAVIGLYHRILLTYVRSRDISGAMRLLGRLQVLTDANKRQSLTEFFGKLRSTAPRTTGLGSVEGSALLQESLSTDALFPKMQFASLFPEIPIAILAELLDLIIESGNLEVGTWMVHSKDVDGPWIPESLYGDQLIAPTLIRFAAETNDGLLLAKLTKAQTMNVSGPTLVALCDNRIRNGRLKPAEEVLRILKEYSIHELTVLEFTTLVKALLLQIYGERASKNVNEPTSKHAAAFLQRLLRGYLGRVQDTSFAQLDTIFGILSSLDPYLSSLCSGLVRRGKDYRIDLPTPIFNTLLEGSARVWGSIVCQTFYNVWCSDNVDRHIPDQSGFEEPHRVEPDVNVLRLFSVPDSDQAPLSGSHSNKVSFRGEIKPEIDTIRVVIQAALDEARTAAAENNAGAPSDEVLQWAAGILRDQFCLSQHEIDYELQGHLIPDEPHLSDQEEHSSQTIQIWRALSGSRRTWARARETELRAFTARRLEREIVFEAAPPAERLLLHCLAADYGLTSETFGDSYERNVRVYKTNNSELRVPRETVEEFLNRAGQR